MVRIRNKRISVLGMILLLIFILLYSFPFGNTKNQDELRNNIPDIKIIGSQNTMKDELLVLSRAADSVIATKKIMMNLPPSKIRLYYLNQLLQQGWREKNMQKIYNKSGVYYADLFEFEKNHYLLSMMIQKPNGDIGEDAMDDRYFKMNQLSYTITVAKSEK